MCRSFSWWQLWLSFFLSFLLLLPCLSTHLGEPAKAAYGVYLKRAKKKIDDVHGAKEEEEEPINSNDVEQTEPGLPQGSLF